MALVSHRTASIQAGRAMCTHLCALSEPEGPVTAAGVPIFKELSTSGLYRVSLGAQGCFIQCKSASESMDLMAG